MLLWGATLLTASHTAGQVRFSGAAELEGRAFDGHFDRAVQVEPRLAISWAEGRRVVEVVWFGLVSAPDGRRSHHDIREATLTATFGSVDLRVGVSRVFWGVTESAHLVDVVNQTDLVVRPDGEAKLGQLMINPTVRTRLGDIELYLLPVFRERTFAGPQGRLRGPIVVDVDRPLHEGRDHPAMALRWRHVAGQLETGLSFFDGADREPRLIVEGDRLRPVYGHARQLGIEAQFLKGATLYKAEVLAKHRGNAEDYVAVTAGLEHTFFGLVGDADAGVIWEVSVDGRAAPGPGTLDNHSFIGGRLSTSDLAGTFLAGVFVAHTGGAVEAFKLEASRRLSNRLRVEVEAAGFRGTSGSPFAPLASDDYLRLAVAWHW